MKTEAQFSLEDLCKATALPQRTVRYYIQTGLIDRPDGAGRGAFYSQRHLDQLLAVVACQRKGMSLDEIREFATKGGASRAVKAAPRTAGSVEVWSHLVIEDGVELHIEPGRAGLSPEQVRALFKQVLGLYERISREKK